MSAALLAALLSLVVAPAHAQSGREMTREVWMQGCAQVPPEPGMTDVPLVCGCLYDGLVRDMPADELRRLWSLPAAEAAPLFDNDARVVGVESGCKQLDASFGGKPVRDTSIETFVAAQGFYTFQLTTDGVYYLLSNPGEGPKAVAGTTVTLRYKALPISGEIVASSDTDGAPLTMTVGAGRMVRGMELGLPLFAKGGKGVLLLPYTLAYGERGLPPAVPPRTTLVMEIEVLEVR